MQAVTITQITPAELKELIESSLREILSQIKTVTQPEPETLLTVEETAKFLDLSIPTIYTKNSKGELPGIKNDGSKRLYFLRTDLIEYLKAGRKKTNAEIEQNAENHLQSLGQKKVLTQKSKKR